MRNNEIPLMLCWMKKSDSHGLVLYDPIWLPVGDVPEVAEKSVEFIRIPSQDLPPQIGLDCIRVPAYGDF